MLRVVCFPFVSLMEFLRKLCVLWRLHFSFTISIPFAVLFSVQIENSFGPSAFNVTENSNSPERTTSAKPTLPLRRIV